MEQAAPQVVRTSSGDVGLVMVGQLLPQSNHPFIVHKTLFMDSSKCHLDNRYNCLALLMCPIGFQHGVLYIYFLEKFGISKLSHLGLFTFQTCRIIKPWQRRSPSRQLKPPVSWLAFQKIEISDAEGQWKMPMLAFLISVTLNDKASLEFMTVMQERLPLNGAVKIYTK